MRRSHSSFRLDRRGISPAFSTVILTAAVVTMLLITMSFASNLLNTKLSENEYSANKQFMTSVGSQLDDVAWTIGRTQTVSFASRFGQMSFQPQILNYTIRIHTSSGWENLTLPSVTGVLMFNMPVASYSMGNNYYERVPISANSSFLLSDSSAPISQVFCREVAPMSDGSYNRIVLAPTMRVLSSSIANTTYLKFYLPSLENSTNPYRSQSVTFTGEGLTKIARSGVDQISLSVGYPSASSLGFNSTFFNFRSQTITLNSTSTPRVPSNSVVEFYIGEVRVTIGQV
jgi:hypothetical protein